MKTKFMILNININNLWLFDSTRFDICLDKLIDDKLIDLKLFFLKFWRRHSSTALTCHHYTHRYFINELMILNWLLNCLLTIIPIGFKQNWKNILYLQVGYFQVIYSFFRWLVCFDRSVTTNRRWGRSFLPIIKELNNTFV